MNKYTPDRPAKQLPDGTIEISLTKDQVTIIDAEDMDLAAFKWHAIAYWEHFRAVREVQEKKVYLHRVILARMLNRELLPGEVVDHINGDPLDNRRSNLRVATHAENVRNQRRHKDSTSGYKGVTWRKRDKRWKAQITANGKSIDLGLFRTATAAHEAYCAAARELHGEFANDGNHPLDTDE